MISNTASGSDQNIKGTPYRVNATWALALALYTGAKGWLTYGVELGKDEAVYWYWSQHLDASYALIPFSLIALAEALAPHGEHFLRTPSLLLGTLSVYWLYRLCCDCGLTEARARWAAAAFACSHWSWHTSSYLHPDVSLTACWLLALRAAVRTSSQPRLANYLYMGAACGLAVLCKYSGAFLTAGLGLFLLISHPTKQRTTAIAAFTAAALCVASPLVYAQLSTAFYLPQTLSTLSKIEALGSPFTRILFFALNPLLFASPLLLYLLYRALWNALSTVRRTWNPDLALAILPALCTLGAFLFFALYRGQIKGNWMLVGLLSLWPLAFHLPVRRWLYPALVLSGLLQAVSIGWALKYPGAVRTWFDRSQLDESYVGLVSRADRAREPSYSWHERVCEYGGWSAFSRSVDVLLAQRGIAAQTPLVSSQYSIPFGLAYYAETPRRYYTVDDPRFRDLTDIEKHLESAAPVLFVARQDTPIPRPLDDRSSQFIGRALRQAPGCAAVRYDLYLLRGATRPFQRRP